MTFLKPQNYIKSHKRLSILVSYDELLVEIDDIIAPTQILV